jgi:hypothetical protein
MQFFEYLSYGRAMNSLDDKHPLHNVEFVFYEVLNNPIDEYPWRTG